MTVAVVSNESIIGSLTPNVYVSNISLESTGQTILNDKNTSTVSIHTAYTEKNPTWITKTKAQGEDLLTNPPSVQYSPSKLKINIDMVLKEMTAGVGQFWVGLPNYHEYVSIISYFTTHSLATKILSIGSNSINFTFITDEGVEKMALSIISLIKNNLLTNMEKEALMGLGLSDASFKAPFQLAIKPPENYDYKAGWNDFQSNLINFLLDHTEAANIDTLANIMKSNMANYENTTTPYLEVDAYGKTMNNYKFTKQHTHDVGNPRHLSFSAMSYLNLEQMTADLGIDFNVSNIPHGKLTYEQIIDNFKVNTKSFIYIDPLDNSIWAGPVHKAEQTSEAKELDVGSEHWRTGHTETADSFTVNKTVVTNAKIHDFRIVERIEKINLDLSFLETQVYNKELTSKHITRDKTEVLKQPAYFTPLHIGRDADGNCRFMFGLDHYTMLIENTLFGKIWQPFSPSQLEDLQLNTKLVNLKVKRRRVENISAPNRLGGLEVDEKPFKTGYLGEPHIDEEEIIETIAVGKDSGTNGFTVNPSGGKLKEVILSMPQPGALGNNYHKYGIRFFTGTDPEMTSITDGHYQYGVELEIIDNTVNFILEQIGLLYESYHSLSSYYEEAILPQAYDSRNNRFRQTFGEKWLFDPTLERPWVNAITILVNVINRFRSPENPLQSMSDDYMAVNASVFNIPSVQFGLTTISDPITGTPRGINALKKVMLDVCKKLSKMAGTTLKRFDDTPHVDDQNFDVVKEPQQAMYKTKATDKRTIKINYWFSNLFNSDIPKHFGYDYLSPSGKYITSQVSTGLHTIKGGDFKNRVSQEIFKYFNTDTFNDGTFDIVDVENGLSYTQDDTPYNTGYTFFTPSNINFKKAGKKTSPGFKVPVVPMGTSPGSNKDQTSSDLVSKSAWSMLNPGVSLQDWKTFSFIASKIMNYNFSGRLSYSDSTTSQSTKTLYSDVQDKIKFHLNEILSHKNCTAVMKADTSKQEEDATVMEDASNYFAKSLIDSSDKIDENLVPTDKKLDPLTVSYTGGSQNSLFLALTHQIANHCLEGDSKQDAQFHINFFTPSTDTEDTIIPYLKAQDGVDVESELEALPNAIKSLILYTNKQAQVRYPWQQIGKNVMLNASYKGMFSLNYQNIKRIEVLTGFEQTYVPNGTQALINSPLWQPLTQQIFDQNVGQSLFCRLKSYINPKLGVGLPSCLEMPVFHEHFILNPSDEGTIQTDFPPVPFDIPPMEEMPGAEIIFAKEPPPQTPVPIPPPAPAGGETALSKRTGVKTNKGGQPPAAASARKKGALANVVAAADKRKKGSGPAPRVPIGAPSSTRLVGGTTTGAPSDKRKTGTSAGSAAKRKTGVSKIAAVAADKRKTGTAAVTKAKRQGAPGVDLGGLQKSASKDARKGTQPQPPSADPRLTAPPPQPPPKPQRLTDYMSTGVGVEPPTEEEIRVAKEVVTKQDPADPRLTAAAGPSEDPRVTGPSSTKTHGAPQPPTHAPSGDAMAIPVPGFMKGF